MRAIFDLLLERRLAGVNFSPEWLSKLSAREPTRPDSSRTFSQPPGAGQKAGRHPNGATL
jgi:hypothetical protein